MPNEVRITILVENSVRQRRLRAEHGLAFHLQFGQHAVLFDTGQTDLVSTNAQQLGLDLSQVETIVLSHGHYDHSGGLEAALVQCPSAQVFLHPAATSAKFSGGSGGLSRSIGMPDGARKIVHDSANVTWTSGMTEVVPGLFATGEIPRWTDYEDVGGQFFLDEQCCQPDPLLDDQALFFESAEGLVVLLGCAHAGVINTLMHIEQMTGNARVCAVMGGMHLLRASGERINQTMAALEQRAMKLIVPVHCTGWGATATLIQHFGGVCSVGGVGTSHAFHR